ncbi:MAG: M48 family metalloprotease [Gammaproteobacteria bacterium]|nr:M48 family metalloprotease [Gammaproteobacteria bacterium]
MSSRSAGLQRQRPVCYSLVVAMLMLSGLTGCQTNPVSGRQDFVLMSEEEEIALGYKSHPEILSQYGGEYHDAALQQYVQQVGERVAVRSHRSELHYRFTVLDSPEVNAFALPGGYVYITRGLMAYLNSEAELAGVLGHEVGHVTARHSVRQISGQRAAGIGYMIGAILVPELQSQAVSDLFTTLSGAISSGYGREHELEADRLGAEYLARSGYDPRAMIDVIGVLKHQEEFERQLAKEQQRTPHIYHGVFASHPENDQRLQQVIGAVATASGPSTASAHDNREQYLQHIKGMVYGDGEDNGIVRGQHFYHIPYDIALEAPSGWRVENQPVYLLIRPGDDHGFIQFTAEDLHKKMTPLEFVQQRLGIDKVSATSPYAPAGLEGIRLEAVIKTASGPRTAMIAIAYHQKRALIFTAVARREPPEQAFSSGATRTFDSLHPLQEHERRLGKPQRLQLVTPTADTSLPVLARSLPLASHAEEQLRLLNGIYPAGVLPAGYQMKIIE